MASDVVERQLLMTSTDTRAERRVRSADGTSIAYERSGKGPALILVEAAGHFRDFSSFATLAEMLANDFSVIPRPPSRPRRQHRHRAVHDPA